jgi:hypothetical protein
LPWSTLFHGNWICGTVLLPQLRHRYVRPLLSHGAAKLVARQMRLYLYLVPPSLYYFFFNSVFCASVLNNIVFLSCRSRTHMSFFVLFTLSLCSTKSTIYVSLFSKIFGYNNLDIPAFFSSC